VKDALRATAWWLLRAVIFRIPVVRRFLTDLVISVEGGLSPVGCLSRAITQAIPGNHDDQIAAELVEIPAGQWLKTRGSHLTLPSGRTLLAEYQAIRESVRGD